MYKCLFRPCCVCHVYADEMVENVCFCLILTWLCMRCNLLYFFFYETDMTVVVRGGERTEEENHLLIKKNSDKLDYFF